MEEVLLDQETELTRSSRVLFLGTTRAVLALRSALVTVVKKFVTSVADDHL